MVAKSGTTLKLWLKQLRFIGENRGESENQKPGFPNGGAKWISFYEPASRALKLDELLCFGVYLFEW